jgi:hypothetical protein
MQSSSGICTSRTPPDHHPGETPRSPIRKTSTRSAGAKIVPARREPSTCGQLICFLDQLHDRFRGLGLSKETPEVVPLQVTKDVLHRL